MESSRIPPTKGPMVQAVQGPAQRDATTTNATNDAKHDVGSGAKPNEQHAMDYTNESMATTRKQGVLTIRGGGCK